MQYEIARLTCNIWKFCRPTASSLLHSMSTPDIRLKRMTELPPHKLPPHKLLPHKLLSHKLLPHKLLPDEQ